MTTPSWRHRLHEVIFEADTRAGKLFDLGLLVAILLSVTAVMLESIESVRDEYGSALRQLEWWLTGLFTVEYLLRLSCVARPLRYARSFFGVVDLLAVLPAYLSLLLPGSQSLAVVRVFRMVRVFRVLKLARFLGEAAILGSALRSSVHKIVVFLVVVASLVVVMGSLMYLIEGRVNPGFANIPQGVYWAIVTVTTVGFGDITPATPLGQVIASFLMVTGFAIIAVPTSIVTSELVGRVGPRRVSTQTCLHCMKEGHDGDAKFCKRCGAALDPPPAPPPSPDAVDLTAAPSVHRPPETRPPETLPPDNRPPEQSQPE